MNWRERKRGIIKDIQMKMDKKTFWIIVGIAIVILLILVVWQTAKISSIAGKAVSGSTGKLDTTGWTENEIMNYEMHGTIPARVQGKVSGASSSGSGMVGGC